MVLTVHHLQISQSERVVWLCEELGLEYELKTYARAPVLAPAAYSALHPIGAAPVIEDGDITLAESEACVGYIAAVHGGGRLTVGPAAGRQPFADYLYWFSFVNGTLQPALGRVMTLAFAGIPPEHPTADRYRAKVRQCFEAVDARLARVPWLAGEEFTAADIMAVFSLSTMRKFMPWDLTPYPNVMAYLQKVAGREAYQRAMKKGDPDLDVQEVIAGPTPVVIAPLVKLYEDLKAKAKA